MSIKISDIKINKLNPILYNKTFEDKSIVLGLIDYLISKYSKIQSKYIYINSDRYKNIITELFPNLNFIDSKTKSNFKILIKSLDSGDVNINNINLIKKFNPKNIYCLPWFDYENPIIMYTNSSEKSDKFDKDKILDKLKNFSFNNRGNDNWDSNSENIILNNFIKKYSAWSISELTKYINKKFTNTVYIDKIIKKNIRVPELVPSYYNPMQYSIGTNNLMEFAIGTNQASQFSANQINQINQTNPIIQQTVPTVENKQIIKNRFIPIPIPLFNIGNNSLNNKIKNLYNKIDHLRKENDDILLSKNQKINKLIEDLKKSAEQIEKLQNVNTALKNQLEEKNKQIQELIKLRNNLILELLEKEQNIDELEKESEQQQLAIQNLTRERNEMQIQIDNLTRQKNDIERQRNILLADIQRLQNILREAEQEIGRLEQKNVRLQNRLREAEQENVRLQQENARLQQERNQLRQEIDQLRQELLNANQNNELLRQRIEVLERQIGNLEQQIGNLEQQIRALQIRIRSLETEIEEKNKQLRRQQEEIIRLNLELDEINRQNINLQEQLQRANMQIQDLLARLRVKDNQIADLNQLIRILQHDKRILEIAINDLNELNQTQQIQIQEKDVEIERLNVLLRQKNDQLEQLREQFALQTEHLEVQYDLIRRLQIELDELRRGSGRNNIQRLIDEFTRAWTHETDRNSSNLTPRQKKIRNQIYAEIIKKYPRLDLIIRDDWKPVHRGGSLNINEIETYFLDL
jgi:hypothetical protein